MAYAQLRVDERTRTYVFASGANVAMTVTFTIALVVFADQGARGLLLGNFGASAIVVLGLWWVLRRRFSLRVAPRRPARDAALRAADGAGRRERVRAAGGRRFYLFRVYSRRRGRASTRSRSSSPRSCSWPCAASSTRGRRWPTRSRATRRPARLYSLVTTYYALATGVVVCARGAARPLDGAAAGRARVLRRLPRAAVAGARMGAVRAVLVFVVIAGRARVTSRNFPAAAAGLAVNVGAAPAARAPQRRGPRDRRRRDRAVRRLRGDARGHVPAHARPVRGRLRMAAPGAAGGDPRRRRRLAASCCCRRSGLAGLALRVGLARAGAGAAAGDALLPPHERAQARALVADGRRRVAAFRAGARRSRGLRRGPAASDV